MAVAANQMEKRMEHQMEAGAAVWGLFLLVEYCGPQERK